MSLNSPRRAWIVFSLIALLLSGCPTVEDTPEDTIRPAACNTVAAGSIPNVSALQVTSGLTNPVQVTNSGFSNDLVVVEQPGTVRVVTNGQLLGAPFLDISDRVLYGGEMGLLGIAFHPNYGSNGRFYVNYITNQGCTRCTRISEFTLGATSVLEDSERIVMTINQPASNHNGGQIAFGPDGFLYIGMGDGGANSGNGQDLTTLHGAMLRIDVDSTATGYAIPPDNPAWPVGAQREIWAYGLRNPWRFNFDPLNGNLYLGDVGGSRVEEIDIIRKGLNYGWDIVEGDQCNGGSCTLSNYTAPIATHNHPGWVAITGGIVYRGSAYPGLCGVYLYGDYSSLPLYGLRYKNGVVVEAPRPLGATISNVSGFGYDFNYEVYAVGHSSGILYRITTP